MLDDFFNGTKVYLWKLQKTVFFSGLATKSLPESDPSEKPDLHSVKILKKKEKPDLDRVEI